jgi:hypothetical protein
LFENGGYRNPRPLDNRFPSGDAWVNDNGHERAG